MSIIERVADIVGAPTLPQRKPAAGGGVDRLEPSVIERTGGDAYQGSDLPAEQTLARQAGAKDRLALDPGKVSRTLNINLDKLRSQNIMTPDANRSPVGESFRRIKRHILAKLAHPKAEARSNLVMITGPLQGGGKTFCTINLAISLAMEMDRTVLLVDADVARPSVLRALGIAEAERGFLDVLVDPSIDLADVMWKTNIEKLSVLPAGTQHRRATELLASETMHALLDEMARRYHDRIVIFDSPPLLLTSEASVLASRMGQIVLVVEADKTTETELKESLRRIESSNVAGLILNKKSAAGADGYGEYGYGYGYGYGS